MTRYGDAQRQQRNKKFFELMHDCKLLMDDDGVCYRVPNAAAVEVAADTYYGRKTPFFTLEGSVAMTVLREASRRGWIEYIEECKDCFIRIEAEFDGRRSAFFIREGDLGDCLHALESADYDTGTAPIAFQEVNIKKTNRNEEIPVFLMPHVRAFNQPAVEIPF